MASNRNDLAAAVEIPAEVPANEQGFELSFQDAVNALTDIFRSTPFGESVLPQVRDFAEKHLPDIPSEAAVALCYRLAAVELPHDNDFDLPMLEIEETEPYSGDVCIVEVINETKDYLRRFVVADTTVINLLSYYAAMTWFCRGLQVVPYLFITSGAPGSGKSTIAQAVTHISYRGCMVSSASSTDALSRICSQRPCTLMIDELDSAAPSFLQEVTSILNAGSSGSGDVSRLIVERNGRGRQQIASLRSFGPKILVGLKGMAGMRVLQPATVSRCITIMTQGAKDVIPEPLPHFKQDYLAAELRRKLAAFADQNGKKFKQASRDLHDLDSLPSRTRDKYRPLMTLATMKGQESGNYTDVDQLWSHLQASEVPEAELGRYLLSACAKILTEIIAPAIRGLQSPAPPTHIQGMEVEPASKLRNPIICTLKHEPIRITNASSQKNTISKLSVLQSGERRYVRSDELLAALLLDDASPLQTSSAGKPMTYAEFCQHLRNFGCTTKRISSARGLFSIQELCNVMRQWLDVFEGDEVLH